MIDLPPLQSTIRSTETVVDLAAAVADMVAHLYLYVGTELAKQPPDPAGEQLMDRLFELVADVHEIAEFTSGDMAREVLGASRPNEQPG